MQKGWVTKSDIAGYAIELLSDGLDNYDENITVLASADSSEDSEVQELMLQVVGGLNSEALEKWRLVILSALNESVLTEEEKIDKLQELYAEFDYPEDMSSCSIYFTPSIIAISFFSAVGWGEE